MIYRVLVTQNGKDNSFDFNRSGTEAISFAEQCKKNGEDGTIVKMFLLTEDEAKEENASDG